MSRASKALFILIIILLPIVAKGGSPEDEGDKGKKGKEKKLRPPVPEEESLDGDRDFVVFLSKCLIVSWLAILALIVGFIFKYKQAKVAQQLAEEAERQKRKNEREKKLLTRSLSKRSSSFLKEKKIKPEGDIQKPRKDTPPDGSGPEAPRIPTSTLPDPSSPAPAVGENDARPATTEERDWYLKKMAELEKLHKEEKEKRLELKKRFKTLTEEKAAADLALEEEKKKYAELEQQKNEEIQTYEEKLDAAFKEKCVEEGKCVELNRRIEEEKIKNAELDKKNVEQAVLLEGERRKYAELNKQFEELNTTLMEMLTSVDKKRQEKKKMVEDPVDDEEF